VGPMILLESLLAQNYHSLYDFLGEIGAQNLGLILTVDSNWCLRRKELELKSK
jgi:hypothetical protein